MRLSAIVILAGLLGFSPFVSMEEPNLGASSKYEQEIAGNDALVRQEIRHLARGSFQFAALPESDQEWVIQKAALNYFFGHVPFRHLLQHIEELSWSASHSTENS